MTPAQKLTKSIRDMLALYGWVSFKVGTGAIKAEGRFIRLSTPGAPDLVAVKGQRYLLIEVKAGKDKLQPSQLTFREQIESVGGNYIVARSVSDVAVAIESSWKVYR